MTKIIGRQASIGIGKESVRGIAVAPTYWVPWNELSIENKVEGVNNESSLARLEDADDSAVVSKWGEATIKAKMKDESLGLFLLSLLGTDTPALVETGVYDHVYTVGQTTQHQSLTLALKDANRDEAFTNAVVDSLKLDGELGNYVMYEVSLLSKASEADTNTVAHSQERDFVPQMVEFKQAVNQAGLDAAGAVSIRNFSIEIKNNLIREDVLGDVEPNDILNQAFAVEGSITLVHDGTTFSDFQNNDTKRALRIKLTHTETIGAASKPTLTIDLYKASIFDYERSLGLNDLVEESFSFKAFYSLADAKMLALTLRNEVASY